MAYVEDRRSVGFTHPEVRASSYDTPEQSDQISPRALATQEIAKTAIATVAGWLESDGFNSVNYPSSTAYLAPRLWLDDHGSEIQDVLVSGLPELDMTTNSETDLGRLDDLRGSKGGHGEELAHDILYGDPLLAAAIESAKRNTTFAAPDTPAAQEVTEERTVESVGRASALAIGRTLLRLHYLTKLSETESDRFSPERLEKFRRVYAQNVLSLMRASAATEAMIQARQIAASGAVQPPLSPVT